MELGERFEYQLTKSDYVEVNRKDVNTTIVLLLWQ